MSWSVNYVLIWLTQFDSAGLYWSHLKQKFVVSQLSYLRFVASQHVDHYLHDSLVHAQDSH